MTEKRYVKENFYDEYAIKKEDTIIAIVDSGTNARKICNELNTLYEENEQLKAQLYSDDEDGICNQCKHHYLVKDEDSELGYYKSRCKKGHYECARVSLVHCEDFKIKNGD